MTETITNLLEITGGFFTLLFDKPVLLILSILLIILYIYIFSVFKYNYNNGLGFFYHYRMIKLLRNTCKMFSSELMNSILDMSFNNKYERDSDYGIGYIIFDNFRKIDVYKYYSEIKDDEIYIKIRDKHDNNIITIFKSSDINREKIFNEYKDLNIKDWKRKKKFFKLIRKSPICNIKYLAAKDELFDYIENNKDKIKSDNLEDIMFELANLKIKKVKHNEAN